MQLASLTAFVANLRPIVRASSLVLGEPAATTLASPPNNIIPEYPVGLFK